MSDKKRKPCPFCGSSTQYYDFLPDSGRKYGSVVCANCAARGPDVRTNYVNEGKQPWHESADREWNNREKYTCQSCGESVYSREAMAEHVGECPGSSLCSMCKNKENCSVGIGQSSSCGEFLIDKAGNG